MSTGEIVLIPFPFAELTNIKVRPALVVCSTKDKYQDLILCAISSVIPQVLTDFEILLVPSQINKLRITSVLKVDRLVTLKRTDVIVALGTLSPQEIIMFKEAFRQLVA